MENCNAWEARLGSHRDEYYCASPDEARLMFRDEYYEDEPDLWALNNISIRNVTEPARR